MTKPVYLCYSWFVHKKLEHCPCPGAPPQFGTGRRWAFRTRRRVLKGDGRAGGALRRAQPHLAQDAVPGVRGCGDRGRGAQKTGRHKASGRWWGKVDSNHRSRRQQIYSLSPLATREFPHIQMWSWWTDLNPRPADYKSAALPTELHQRIQQQ